MKKAYEMQLAGATIQEIADHYDLSYEALRSRLRRYRRRHNLPSVGGPTAKEEGKHTTLNDAIHRPLTMDELIDCTGLTERMIAAGLEEMSEQGLNITCIDGVYQLRKDKGLSENKHKQDWSGDKTITFGVVSDTHMGSIYEQLTFLNELYDIFQQRKISEVYHAGDITEGDYSGRQGHIYERHKHGADQQVDYVVKNYPRREGVTTYFIGGNHDATHLRNGGVDILRMIDRRRDDMINLGWDNAKINLTPNCILEMNHPLGGSAYAYSYRLQKYLEVVGEKDKPSILIQGHHHKAIYYYEWTKNIHAFEAGTTQAQSAWMRNKRLSSHVAGWVITVQVDESGTIQHLIPELIPMTQDKEDDYK